jgi:hypothetical protein
MDRMETDLHKVYTAILGLAAVLVVVPLAVIILDVRWLKKQGWARSLSAAIPPRWLRAR